MGFNISGLAINKNFQNDFDLLQNKLGWNLKKQSEIDFDIASSNWKEEGICDVFYTEKGTLLFMDIDMCTESIEIEGLDTLSFGISETSMTFILNYCENGIVKRTIMESDGERFEDHGNQLEVEETSEDTSEIIWSQIEQVIGRSFWSIEPEESAVRYVFVAEKNQKPMLNNDPLNSYQEKNKIRVENTNSKVTSKKWWEFWK